MRRARAGARSRSPAAPQGAQVEASPDAEVEREVVHDGSGHLAELVRVHAGSVHVASAHAGEHVQVATADARVDGEGAIDLDVADDHLRAITVRAGTATLKVRDQQVVVLAAGQTWKAPIISAQLDVTPTAAAPGTASASAPASASGAAASAPAAAAAAASASGAASAPGAAASAPAAATASASGADSAPGATAASAEVSVPAPAAAHTTSREPAHDGARRPHALGAAEPAPDPAPVEPAPPAQPAPEKTAAQPAPVEAPVQSAPHGRSATEQHFAAGYALLQQGKPAEAARELATAADSDGDPALAADARYFQAIALARAGRKTEAEAALVAFLDHAPRSLRRGRAAVMLAKLIAERGDRDSARRWFESALGDPDPAVVAAARAGLAGL